MELLGGHAARRFEIFDGPPLVAGPAAPNTGGNGIVTLDTGGSSKPAFTDRYSLKAGDSLYGIAVKLNHDSRRLLEIAAANPGLYRYRARPGSFLGL